MNKPYHGSLLDPRTHGWKLVESWPTVFDLYIKGDEARAELSPEVQSIENALQRGHSIDDVAALDLEGALFFATVIFTAPREGADASSFGFQYLRQQIADKTAASLGPVVLEILSAKTREKAELAAERTASLMKRAAGGLVRMKYPGKGRGNKTPTSKAVLAILYARFLCAELRRLPTKREVRALLEENKVLYAKGNDVENKWHELFVRAGLSALPD